MAANLLPLAETDVRHPIPPNLLQEALSTAPFLVIPGTFNTRDLGLLSRNHPKIRPGFIYRTGALSSLQAYPSSQAHLRDTHNIRRIFDMRSQAEHTRGADPVIEGVEGVWLGADGVTEKEARVDLAPFVEGEGETGYVAMYLDVLRQYQGIIREVLRSVRDRPAEGILFHCTAGRDRTGVLAGLLESLAGYDAATVRADFLLSRIGTEPARTMLLQFAIQGAGMALPAEAKDDMEMLFEKAPLGFYNLVSLKAACWDAFVEAVDREWGGFEGYVKTVLGFGEEDLVTIRRNLVEAP